MVRLLTFCCLTVAASFAAGAPPGPRLKPLTPGDVTLTEGPLRAAFEKNRQYLRSLDPDRFLWAFRKTAGLAAPSQPYGGWELPEIEVRGHSTGHYLSALARTVALSKDPELKQKADYLVAELAKCQARFGNGYLSAFPESFFDRVEAFQPVWAPYYTIHKIMLGLLDMYRYAGNRQALDVVRGMADYFLRRTDKLNDSQMQRMLNNEYGGMQELLLNLNSDTGDTRYLRLAERFEKRIFIDPLISHKDVLPGLHANTHIPQIAGAARRYELTGETSYRKAVEFFWERVAQSQSFATGGSNWREHWLPASQLSGGIGDHSQEFCTSYNWLKITRYLLSWTGDARYGDMYERNFYNGILAGQHPETGMFIYMLPLGPGSRKRYGTADRTFTCCYGTAVQSFASLAENIYYQAQDALYVNLYAPSEVRWKRQGRVVTVTQRTQYPEEEATHLQLAMAQPSAFRLVVRIPWWAVRGAEVNINGTPWREAAASKPGSWLEISRQWSNGDRVDLHMPMSLYTQAINDDDGLRAILYGPMVLAGETERYGWKVLYPAPVLTGGHGNPESWIKPVAGQSLVFETSGQPMNLTLRPVSKIVSQRYGVYWRFASAGSKEVEAFKETLAAIDNRNAKTVDFLVAGDEKSEREHARQAELEGYPVVHHQWFGRDVTSQSSASYVLKVAPEGGNVLLVGYEQRPELSGVRVSVNDREIGVTPIASRGVGASEVAWPLPLELTRGRSEVKLQFQAADSTGKRTGRVLGATVLRR